MKKISVLFVLMACFAILINAQPTDCQSDRYQKRVFNNIQITNDITYGNAQNVIGFNQSLELNFYEPAPSEEYLGKRPLVVLFFGGAYILGSKADADMRAWCDSLAHYGYACASVEYRLDNAVNFALPNQGVRAAYRAIQDGRAAIRYLLEDPNGLGFNVDPAHIYTGGESAGAITAIHIAYLEESERPAETFSIGFSPDLGCIDCSGNNYVQPFSIAGIIDLWGATLDLNFIDAAENVPMVIIHGTDDTTVPYTSGSPFGVPLLPTMYGAVPMDAEMTAKNICHQFYPYPGEGHVIYGIPSGIVTFPNQYWPPIFAQGHTFLYDKTLRYDSPVPNGALSFCEGSTETYDVPATPGSNYCWSVTNGLIVSSNNNQVTVNWNSSPGTLTVTETNCIDVVGNPQSINVMPTSCCSPVNLAIQFDSFPGQSSWDITDANGNTVATSNSYNGFPNNSSTTENTCLPNGCYTLNFYDALNNGMCPFQSSAVGVSTFITPGTLITPGSIVGTLSLVATPGLCGNYSLSDASGTTLVSGGGSFGGSQSQTFCINTAPRHAYSNESDSIDKTFQNSTTSLQIFPNVAQNFVQVQYSLPVQNSANIALINMQGKIVQQQTQSAFEFPQLTLDISDLPKGMYWLRINNNNGLQLTERLVKQ